MANFQSVLKFDGVDDHIVLPAMNVDYSRGITVEAWARFNSFKHFSRIIDFSNGAASSNIIFCNQGTTNNFALYVYRGGDGYSLSVSVNGLLEIGRWTHLAATVDASGKAKIYANGRLVNVGNTNQPENINRIYNYIGKSAWSSDGYFDGQIAEVRLWNRTRTQDELQQNLYRRLAGNEADLVGYWPLNEGAGNTVVTDRSVSANHGTINGATWEEQVFLQPTNQLAPFQNVLVLDGQDDYIEIPYTASLNPSKFTVSCWVKVQGGQGGFRSIITSRDDYPQRGYIIYAGNDNKFQFWIGAGSAGWRGLFSDSQIVLNTWTHLSATCDGTNLKFYVDGKVAAQGSGNYTLNTARPLRIGAGSTEGNPSYFLPGEIADVSIWNRVLSKEEIQKQMDVRLVGNEPGLVGYWPLNEGAGSITADKSTIANHGQIKGGAIWQRQLFVLSVEAQAALAVEEASLKSKFVLSFDGQDDCINLGKKPLFKIEKNLTLEAWVYVEKNDQEWVGIFSNVYDTGATESGYCLALDGKGGAYFGMTPSSTKRIIYLSSGANSLGLNEWHHVAGVYDAQQMIIYIDGVQKGTQAVSSPSISYEPENNLHIGVYKDDNEAYYIKGKISEVRLWNVARSPEEVKNNSSYRLTGNEAGLVGYWPLNEGSGNTVSDKTIQGNHGPISGATWEESTLKLAPAKAPKPTPVDADKEKAIAELKAALEKALAEKAAAEAKAAVDAKAAADAKVAMDQAVADKAAAEKAALDANAAKDKALTEKAAAEKATLDANAAKDKALTEKAAAEKAALDANAAKDKALTEKAAAEKAALDANAAKDKALTEKAAAEAKLAAQAQQGSSHTTQTATSGLSVLAFDGKNSCVNLGKKADFKIEKNITLEAWVYAENPRGISGILSNVFDTGLKKSGYGLLFDSPSGIFFALKPQGEEFRRFSSGLDTFKLNEWQHIAGTYDGQRMKVYINGVEKATKEIATKDTPIHYDPENDLLIGMFKDDDEIIPFKGKITEVRLWNQTRSLKEIQKEMNRRLQGNESGLVAYWPLNEGAGNTVSDKTSRGNHGTINQATWQEQGSLPLTQTQQSSSQTTQTQPTSSSSTDTAIRFQPVLAFDGKTACVNLGKKPAFKIEQTITLEAWVFAEKLEILNGIISSIFDKGSTESGYGLLLDGKGGVYLGVKPTSGGLQYAASRPGALKLNEWHHIAGTYDGQRMKVYVDGVEKATQTMKASSINYEPENDLLIGMYKDDSQTRPFNGKIIEVRLWNRARSPEDLQKDMNRYLQGNESGLVGYWLLNEGSGNTVSDKTNRGNHGMINEAIWQQ